MNRRALACKHSGGDDCALVGLYKLKKADAQASRFWFCRGAERDSKLSKYYLAYLYYLEKEHERSEGILAKLVNASYPPAMYTWAMLTAYRRWHTEPKSSFRPRELLNSAADLGHQPSRIVLLSDEKFFELSPLKKLKMGALALFLIVKVFWSPSRSRNIIYLTWPDFDRFGYRD